MSTLADSMLSWKANLTTRATPEQVLTLMADVNAFADGVRLLEAENAKLVDVLHEVEQEAIYAYHCLQQDCVTISNGSVHFFKKWWHAECELDRTREENAMLRQENKSIGMAAYELGSKSMADENAKLRESVRHLMTQRDERLAHAESENAKLREECKHWRVEQVHAYGNWEDAHKRAAELESENAKLRELAVGMYGLFEMFDKMLGNHDACETPRPLIFGEDKSFKDVMRELGIEVSE